MNKTAADLAEEFVNEEDTGSPTFAHGLRNGFLAGYQAAAGQWISVKDRLPELEEQVLVYGRASMQSIRLVQPAVLKKNYSYQYNPLAWEFEWEGFDIIGHDGEVDDVLEVTHWMPLPEPPKDATV